LMPPSKVVEGQNFYKYLKILDLYGFTS